MKFRTLMLTTATPFALAACSYLGMGGKDDKMAMEMTTPMLSATAQPAGNSVTIAEADIPEDGFLVIHAMKDGKPVVPGSIGHVAIKAGKNSDVTVPLTMMAEPGTQVLAMLHQDTGTKGVYEFGPGSTNVDLPVMKDGKPVVLPVTIK